MREVSKQAIELSNQLMFEFKKADSVFTHAMAVLDLLYDINKGKPFKEIEERVNLYQDVLYYVTRIQKNDTSSKWKICPMCETFGTHTDTCILKQ